MQIHNTPSRYGSVAKAFHWIIAFLILIEYPLGEIANGWPMASASDLDTKFTLFSAHKTLGLLIFLLALLRILWALFEPRPRPLHPDRPIETWLAHVVHWLLYFCLVLVPLTGWAEHAATSGLAPIWWPFGQGLPFIPKSEFAQAIFAGMHGALTSLLLITVGLHVAGALKHWLIDRDLTLARMLPGKPLMADQPLPQPAPAPRLLRLSPFAGAALILCATLFVGAFGGWLEAPEMLPGEAVQTLDMENPEGFGELESLPLPEPASEAASEAGGNGDPRSGDQPPMWEVTEGEISFTVSRFGDPVEGRFARWDARIAYDPALGSEGAGQVRAQIDITSLDMGSLTQQALGPDFFDAADHPKAAFEADIRKVIDGHIMHGTLRLKGVQRAVEMPLSLRIKGDVAEADATISLDRFAFGIGENIPDTSVLGGEVQVNVELKARRRAE